MREMAQARDLLDWYDVHARDLAWRVGPAARSAGVRPDPYRVWLSEVMLQQTTVAAVAGYFQHLQNSGRMYMRWRRPGTSAVMGAWAGLGYYARARNLLKCARIVSRDLGGVFPDTLDGLRALPGVGPYTAAAVAAIAFDRPNTVVDGNVERVMARLHGETTPLPAAKKPLTSLAERLTPAERPGDYAQAVMDLGATICTPRNPACGICPWRGPLRGAARGESGDVAAAGAESGEAGAEGVRVARAAGGRGLAVGATTGKRPSGIDAWLAWHRVERRPRGRAARLRAMGRGGRGAPHVYTFSPASDCLGGGAAGVCESRAGVVHGGGGVSGRGPPDGDAQGAHAGGGEVERPPSGRETCNFVQEMTPLF